MLLIGPATILALALKGPNLQPLVYFVTLGLIVLGLVSLGFASYFFVQECTNTH